MRQKEYLILSVSTLVIIILWVVFTIYHNYTTSTVDPTENYTVIPIDGAFDQEAINQIKNRKRVNVTLDSISQIQIASPSPSPSPSPTPQLSTTSGTLTPSPTP